MTRHPNQANDMTDVTQTNQSATATPTASPDMARKHLRGSSLLLLGRVLAVLANFAVQVMIVRYLSKTEFGAFAYALSVVSMGSSIAVFGLDKSVTRFLPIYLEQNAHNKVFGTIVMMAGTIMGIGAILVAGVFLLKNWIGSSLVSDPRSLSLLLFLIVLAPIQALDNLFIGLFAVFARPSAIFFPRHLMTPLLQLAVVLLVVFKRGDVYLLSLGYVIGGVLGIGYCTWLLVRLLREQNLLERFHLRSLEFPGREVFGFTVPLLTTDLVYILRTSVLIILLEHMKGTAEVAGYRAVLPVSRLNLLILQSFTLLYTPMAARMFARRDYEGINQLYWQTAAWIAVISFPIFVVSFSLATPLTLLLFGERYSQSAIILALLALGHYGNAALGFNGLTLRVYGQVRYLFGVEILTALTCLAISLPLIPRYGALGAAIGSSATLLLQNALYQAGLGRNTGILIFDRRCLRVYGSLVFATLALYAFQRLTGNPYMVFSAAILVCIGVLLFNRKALRVAETFPELLRVPLVGRLLT